MAKSSRSSRPMFSRMQRMVLVVCAVIIVLGGGLLLIDALFIRGKPSGSSVAADSSKAPDVTLSDVASRLGLQLSLASSDAEMLQNALASFPELDVADARVGPVMSRADQQHRLWLFEFDLERTLVIAPDSTATGHAHSGTLTRLGIAIRLRDARLPRWVQGDDGDVLSAAPRPPWNDEALQRLARIEDLRLAMAGEFVIAVARPGAFALLEQVQRDRSAEFHPGLRNSALPIDVQRVVDIVNLLEADPGQQLAALPPVYRVDVNVDLSNVRMPQLGARMDAIREKNQRDLAALREKLAAQRNATTTTRSTEDQETVDPQPDEADSQRE